MWLHKMNNSWRENLAYWVASKMPAWLIYWCAIVLGSYGTTGKHGDVVVPESTLLDLLRVWREERLTQRPPDKGGRRL